MASIPLEIQAMVIAALGKSKNLSASETADIWGNVRFVSKFFLQEVETMFRKKFLPEVSLNLECRKLQSLSLALAPVSSTV